MDGVETPTLTAGLVAFLGAQKHRPRPRRQDPTHLETMVAAAKTSAVPLAIQMDSTVAAAHNMGMSS